MSGRNRDALLRSDRILVSALAMVLVAASAAVGATATYHPNKEDPKAAELALAPIALVLQNAAAEQIKFSVPTQTDVSVNGTDMVPVAERPVFRTSAEQTVLDKLLREHKCLSEAMYYEARGEGVGGEKAVAEVIFHRLNTGRFGRSICAVVYEGAYRPGCQFSFTCNGVMNQAKMTGPWMQTQLLAARILTGEERLYDTTGGATSYHAITVQPDWAAELIRTVQIGNHIFYRKPSGARTM
jgi:spore germination cell wall hydrolase CwlJ-like protein